MRTSALRRAVTAWIVLSICALVLGSGIVGNTFASFNAETTNGSSTFSGGWLASPTAGTATAGGYDMNLGWTAPGASVGGVQNVLGVDNGTSNTCTGASYASIATGLSTTTSTYSDANRANSTNDGDWFCYELTNTLPADANWSVAADVLPAVQIGLAATGLTIANSGTTGTVNKNDTITVTFNQRTILANQATMTVCVFKTTTNVILIGDTSGCASATTDTYTIGKLTVSGATLGSNATFSASSTTVQTTTAPWTVQIKLGSSTSPTSVVTGTPTWTFTPIGTGTTALKSNQTTDQATACAAAKTTCQPTSTNNF